MGNLMDALQIGAAHRPGQAVHGRVHAECARPHRRREVLPTHRRHAAALHLYLNSGRAALHLRLLLPVYLLVQAPPPPQQGEPVARLHGLDPGHVHDVLLLWGDADSYRRREPFQLRRRRPRSGQLLEAAPRRDAGCGARGPPPGTRCRDYWITERKFAARDGSKRKKKKRTGEGYFKQVSEKLVTYH